MSTPFVAYVRFCEEADKLRAMGVKHYSARTIGEYLRHETALSDGGQKYKLNNNNFPRWARYYMDQHNCHGFFTLRGKDA